MSHIRSRKVVYKSLDAICNLFFMTVLASVLSFHKDFIEVFGEERIDQGRHAFSLGTKLALTSFDAIYLDFLGVTSGLSRVNEHRRRNERVKDPRSIVVFKLDLNADN